MESEAGDSVLVEVWISEAGVERLQERLVHVRGVRLIPEGDGTFSLGLVVTTPEARAIDWPVHGPGAEHLVRG